MKFTPLTIPDVLLIELKVFGDERGFFIESFNHREFEAAVGNPVSFVQDNHSTSSKGGFARPALPNPAAARQAGTGG
jgi:dTDP-4-dehydrorhamnose 3,5-epimerase